MPRKRNPPNETKAYMKYIYLTSLVLIFINIDL